jgi:hypothetical protein
MMAAPPTQKAATTTATRTQEEVRPCRSEYPPMVSCVCGTQVPLKSRSLRPCFSVSLITITLPVTGALIRRVVDGRTLAIGLSGQAHLETEGHTHMKDRIPADVELAWDNFHEAVNMTSDELRTWLLTESSGEDAFVDEPDLQLPELGRKVVEILRKRKVDLTREDADVMRRVSDYVAGREANRPAEGTRNDQWRHSLMTVGHDPLKP